MKQPRQTFFTADEFIDWAMNQPSGRYELDGGVVIAISPERVAHTRTKFDAAVAFKAAIAARGLACEAIPDGISVRVDDHTVYEPDLLVRCGPRAPGETIVVDDPVVVVEVISPSSRGADTGAKLVSYFRLPSVWHYLVLDTDKRIAVHYRRAEAGAIAADIRHDGTLVFDPPGIEVAVADVFTSL